MPVKKARGTGPLEIHPKCISAIYHEATVRGFGLTLSARLSR
jgi:hypothetical protein